MSVFGVILVCIFPHSDWIRRDISRRVSLRIQSKYGKIQTRITPNMDTFHAVNVYSKVRKNNSTSSQTPHKGTLEHPWLLFTNHLMYCVIWYHLHNLKNMKPVTLLKVTLLHVFFTFFKLHKWRLIAQRITFIRDDLEYGDRTFDQAYNNSFIKKWNNFDTVLHYL